MPSSRPFAPFEEDRCGMRRKGTVLLVAVLDWRVRLLLKGIGMVWFVVDVLSI